MANFVIVLPSLLFLSGCMKQVPMDTALSAHDGRALTVVFKGCGQINKGYLFCSLPEGVQTGDVEIELVAPTRTCERETCLQYQFLRRDGSLGFAGSSPMTEERARVPLSSILDFEGPLDREHAGEYQVMIRVWWVEEDGTEQTSRADGLVRVWVTEPRYRIFTCNDPELAWYARVNRSCHAEYSTGLRSALCGYGCSH